MIGMIWFHSVKSQPENDFLDIWYIVQTFFIVFLYHFWSFLYTVVNYPNTLFTRSILALSAHKSNKIYNKIQNILFPLPIDSATSKTVSPKKNVVLLNFCLRVYIRRAKEDILTFRAKLHYKK